MLCQFIVELTKHVVGSVRIVETISKNVFVNLWAWNIKKNYSLDETEKKRKDLHAVFSY